MTAERWSQIREPLEAAMELPEAEVAAYLDAHCAPDVREEVESLLDASKESESFLDEPQCFPEMFTQPGTRIGPYEIQEPAGYGGIGVVYRARDQRLGRSVAVKLLPLSIYDLDLLDEARAASALNHPNIVIVHDVLEYRGATAMVMEFVDGRTVRDLLAEGPLDLAKALDYARQIASALEASHQAGIVHRDLKPSNVIVRGDGVVRVLDFGISHTSASSNAGVGMGTVGYVSPEQAAGRPVDTRTDIYAFGAMLKEMLGPKLPPRLRRLAERCLEPEPDARPSSMREVAAALELPSRRYRFAAMAALVVIAAGLLSFSLLRDQNASKPYRVKRVASFDTPMLFPVISPDGERLAYSSLDGKLSLQQASEATGRELKTRGRHPTFSPDGTRLAIRSGGDGGGIFLLNLSDDTARKLTAGGFHPAWSPDGARIVFSSESFLLPEVRPTTQSQLSIVETATGQVRTLTDPALVKDAIQPSWSPDGRRIAYWSVNQASRRSVWTIAASGGVPVQVTDGKSFDWNPVWSPDGHLYWASGRNGGMSIWRVAVDPDTGQVRGAPEVVSVPAAHAAYLSFARSGRLSYVNVLPISTVWKVGLVPASTAVALTPRSKRLTHPSPSPDGEWIVASAEEGSTNLVTFRSDGSGFQYLTTGEFRDADPSWSPDGRTIVFVSNRGVENQLWTIQRDGTGMRQITTSPEGAFSAIWSPDGKGMAWFSRGYRPHVVLALGEPELPMADPGADGFRPRSWSSDGKKILGQLKSGERYSPAIYDLDSGRYEPLKANCNVGSWLPGTGRIVCMQGTSLSIVDPSGGKAQALAELPRGPKFDLVVSRDGRFAYFTRVENMREFWLADPPAR